MVSPSKEGEDKVFTAVEVQEMLDKQCNKLDERVATLELRFSALDEKNAHPEVVEVPPKEKPNSDKARLETPRKLDGPPLHAKPYEYPLERVPMPHMNPSSGAPPMLDEFNLTIPIGSLACALILGVFVWSFGAMSRMGTLPLMRSTWHPKRELIVNSTPPL
jgi:hypothetical protein